METRKLLAMKHTDMKDIEMQDKEHTGYMPGSRQRGHGSPGTCDTGQRIESHRSCGTGWGLRAHRRVEDLEFGTWDVGRHRTWSMRSTARMEVSRRAQGCWSTGDKVGPWPPATGIFWLLPQGLRAHGF